MRVRALRTTVGDYGLLRKGELAELLPDLALRLIHRGAVAAVNADDASRESRTAKQPDHPLDHDGDGRPGGSLPAGAPNETLSRLRQEFEELTGSKPHHLWREKRLQSEIDKALAK